MAGKNFVITLEGLKKLEQELEHLRTVRRHEIAEKIKVAREFGDISENAEYDEAKNEQAFVEGKIAEIERKLKVAKVIDEEDIKTDKVGVGTTVKVLDMEFDEECEYTIVGSAEADPMNNKISNESPVGMALIGAQRDQVVNIEVPDGEVSFKVLEIYK